MHKEFVDSQWVKLYSGVGFISLGKNYKQFAA